MKREGRNRVVFHSVAFMRSAQTNFDFRSRADQKELNNYEAGNLIPAGVYTLDDVKKYGQEKGVCPYFTIRRMVSLTFSLTFALHDHGLLDERIGC